MPFSSSSLRSHKINVPNVTVFSVLKVFNFDYFMGFVERCSTFVTVFKMLSWTISFFLSWGFEGKVNQFSKYVFDFSIIWISTGVNSVMLWCISFIHDSLMRTHFHHALWFYFIKGWKISKALCGFFPLYYFGDDELKKKLLEFVPLLLYFSTRLAWIAFHDLKWSYTASHIL